MSRVRQDAAAGTGLGQWMKRLKILGHCRRIEVRLALMALAAAAPMAAINFFLISGGDPHRRDLTLASTAAALIFSGIIVAVIAAGVRRILNRVAETLQRSIREINGASAQLERSSQSLADSANDQAAALQETAASLEGVVGLTRRNTKNAQKTNTLTREARTAADAGTTDVRALNDAIHELKTTADGIERIVKTIDEIAFQTNLLAINAAVEAARAGAAGMGFGVVADEVRSLAQRSAGAAKETAARIESTSSRTSAGVQLGDRVAKAFSEIVSRTRQVDDLAAQVASASAEQSSSIEQLGIAVSQMNQVTQNSAANAEENAAAAEELRAQAASLNLIIGELSELAGIRPVTAPEARPYAPQTRSAAAQPTTSTETTTASGGNGNDRPARPQPRNSAALATRAARQKAIPLEGDFEDQ